jgi:hypothetical protein
MANTFVGVGVLWGFPGTTTGATLTGFSPVTQIQGLEYSRKAQKDQVKDNTGNTSMVAYSDHEDNFSIDFVPNAGTNTGTLTVTALPSPGTTLAFTDTNFTVMTATFIVDEVSVSRANNKAMMAKLSLSRYLNNGVPA